MMNHELWQEQAKRIGGEHLIGVIEEIRDMQTAILKRLDTMDDRHEANDRAVADLKKAFPGGDVDGHCRYHSVQIEMLTERRRLRQAVQEKTISGLVWLGIVGIGTAVWRAIVSALK